MTKPAAFSISPTLDAIGQLRSELGAMLDLQNFDRSIQDDILLAVSEIASNIVRHADPAASAISVDLARTRQGPVIRIYDDGGPFDRYNEKFSAHVDTDIADCLGESGMGIALVANLFPRQHYDAADSVSGRTQNCLTLFLDPVQTTHRRPNIAVVDDDQSLRELLKLYLSDEFDVVTFESGLEALESLARAPVDLVISDIRMPVMDGFELRRRLEALPEAELIPFIFLTGDREDETRAQAAGLSVDDFLIKNVRKQELSATVTRVLNRATQLRQRLGDRLDREITAALRPELPQSLGNFRAAVRSRNASAGGGDFLSWRNQGTSHSLILGDIMGHGEQAKFFAHAHAGFFVGLLYGTAHDGGPGQWLSALSRASTNNPLLEATLVTCLALELKGSGEIIVACAGHPPPLLVSRDNITELPVSGTMPALGAQERYIEARLILKQQRLLLYTDGLFDSADNTQSRSHLRSALLNVLKNSSNRPLEEVADELIDTFDKIAGENPKDDATFVLLEHTD